MGAYDPEKILHVTQRKTFLTNLEKTSEVIFSKNLLASSRKENDLRAVT